MGNKTPLITPFLMLTAGTIASIIMYVRGFEFNTMLWILLIVLVIFYIIGDIARYLYASVRPRIIPAANIDHTLLDALMNGEQMSGNVVAVADGKNVDTSEDSTEELSADGFMSEESEGYSDEDDYSEESEGDSEEEGYSEEELGEYEDEEFTDEN